jgi:hypothetical protein
LVGTETNTKPLPHCTDNVRFGSKADMCNAPTHVRFTPESGHARCKMEYPLWAKCVAMKPSPGPLVLMAGPTTALDPHVDLVAQRTEVGLTHLDLLLMEGDLTQRGPPVRLPTLHGGHGAKIAAATSGRKRIRHFVVLTSPAQS